MIVYQVFLMFFFAFNLLINLKFYFLWLIYGLELNLLRLLLIGKIYILRVFKHN